MRVLGIDPGLRTTGYACLETVAPGVTPRIVEAGVFRLVRGGTRGGAAPAGSDGSRATGLPSIADRLLELDCDFGELLRRTSPGLVAIEGLFAHYRHPATAIVMGHARGILLLGARRAQVEIVELKPREVKKAVSGFGGAGKDQVQRTMQDVFQLSELPTPPDMADAMAIALCAARRVEAARREGAGDPSESRASRAGVRASRVPKLSA